MTTTTYSTEQFMSYSHVVQQRQTIHVFCSISLTFLKNFYLCREYSSVVGLKNANNTCKTLHTSL